MKRRHLVELHELAWFPRLLRRLGTDYLQEVCDFFRPFEPACPLLAEALRSSGTNQVLDLCSGSGGPWWYLAPELTKLLGSPVVVRLSDKFPPATISPRLRQTPGLTYHPQPVDAAAVPAEMPGLRTFFNSFHHFPPPQARTILQAAVSAGQPVAVLEMLQRNWRDFLMMCLTPLYVWLMTPRIRPFRFSRFLFTFLVPIVPLYLLWDTLVSVLRCYTPAELLAMTRQLAGPAYTWQAGTYWHRGLPVTYLVGYPQGAEQAAAHAPRGL